MNILVLAKKLKGSKTFYAKFLNENVVSVNIY